MFLPIKTDSPLRGVPWMNWLLIAINILVFVVQSQVHSYTGMRGWYLNAQRPQLYQFFTYAFLHADIWHIAGNMLFLYIFGNSICDRLGNIAYLAFYLAGGVFAAIGYTILNQQGMVIGASGAVAAVTGAYVALLPRSHITIFYWFFLFGLFELPSLWVIGAFFLQDAFFSFSRQSGVAHLAHVSGSIFGFMVSLLLLKSRLLARDHFDMLSLIDRWNRRRQYQAVVSEGYDPFNYSSPPPIPGMPSKPTLAPKLFDQVQDLRAQVSEALAHGQLDQATAFYQQLRQLDPSQTLSRGAQLDVANHLYSRDDYANAAQAYELYLKNYRDSEQAGLVRLMLGMAYGRYLNEPGKARENLVEAVKLLQFARELDMAKTELARLGGDTTGKEPPA